jgi:uncharacterized cupredoxin-like copper-binding protein
MQFKVVVVVGLLLLVAAGAFLYHSSPNVGSAVNPATSPAVTVTMTDNSLQPSVGSVVGGQVTFTVTNNGTMEHELVVLKTDLAPNALPLQPDATAIEDSTGVHHSGELASLQPGETKTLTLNLTPGEYVLLCNFPEHYLAGMYGGLNVQ